MPLHRRITQGRSSNINSEYSPTGREQRRNKRRPEALEREIVAATLMPAASVSAVARPYDVNANQVFGWHRRYGEASTPAAAPVHIEVGVGDDRARAGEHGRCNVSDCRIRVGSSFYVRTLKRVLDVLRKR